MTSKIDIESLLENYDKVFLISILSEEISYILEQLDEILLLKIHKEKILFLSTIDIFFKSSNIMVYKITESEKEYLKKIYFTYEFSNQFQLISVGKNFADVWNYVETGLLTTEDTVGMFLY